MPPTRGRYAAGREARRSQTVCVPLRLGVDAWNLPHDRRGVGRYVRSLLRCWHEGWAKDVELYLVVDAVFAPFVAARYRTAANLPRAKVITRREVGRTRLQCVWFPWNGMSWVSPTVNVATLHDASVFRHPPASQAIALAEQRPFRTAAEHARRIITASAVVKTELTGYLGIAPEKIDVIPDGVDEGFFSAGIAERDGARTRVLFVGEPEARKRLDLVLAALPLVHERWRHSIELVVVGASGRYPMPPLPPTIAVRNLGVVDDSALVQVYREAGVLLYPSVYEGFGLPIVEAMAAGTPVIAADTPVARETGGDAALYFRADDARELAAALERLLIDRELRLTLARRGQARVQDLRWERTAELTLLSIERAVATA